MISRCVTFWFHYWKSNDNAQGGGDSGAIDIGGAVGIGRGGAGGAGESGPPPVVLISPGSTDKG